MTGTAVMVYTEPMVSIDTSGCQAYLKLLPQLRGKVSELYGVTPHLSSQGALQDVVGTTIIIKIPREGQAQITELRSFSETNALGGLSRLPWYQITPGETSWSEPLQISSVETRLWSLFKEHSPIASRPVSQC